MTLAALRDLSAALARAHVRIGTDDDVTTQPEALARPTGWAELDAILPDGGLPYGIVEMACASPQTRARAYAGATSIATAAIARALGSDDRTLAAWIDPDRTLHAPGLVQAGVDVHRLLVVRPPPPVSSSVLGRVAIKVVASGAFAIVVVDMAHDARRAREAPELVVRKLALAAESSGATVVLLTEPARMPPRTTPWPVAMRLDVTRVREGISLSIPKERRGRVQTAKITVAVPARVRSCAASSR